MDIQAKASLATGLPEDLDLMTGDPLIDLSSVAAEVTSAGIGGNYR